MSGFVPSCVDCKTAEDAYWPESTGCVLMQHQKSEDDSLQGVNPNSLVSKKSGQGKSSTMNAADPIFTRSGARENEYQHKSTRKSVSGSEAQKPRFLRQKATESRSDSLLDTVEFEHDGCYTPVEILPAKEALGWKTLSPDANKPGTARRKMPTRPNQATRG